MFSKQVTGPGTAKKVKTWLRPLRSGRAGTTPEASSPLISEAETVSVGAAMVDRVRHRRTPRRRRGTTTGQSNGPGNSTHKAVLAVERISFRQGANFLPRGPGLDGSAVLSRFTKLPIS